MTAVSALSEAEIAWFSGLGALEGKLGANVRGLLGKLEELEPIIAAGAKVENNNQQFDPARCVDALSKAFELDARLDGLIDKTIQRFVVAKEGLSRYARKSAPKLITHDASAAKKMIVKDELDEDNDNDNDYDYDKNRPDPEKVLSGAGVRRGREGVGEGAAKERQGCFIRLLFTKSTKSTTACVYRNENYCSGLARYYCAVIYQNDGGSGRGFFSRAPDIILTSCRTQW